MTPYAQALLLVRIYSVIAPSQSVLTLHAVSLVQGQQPSWEKLRLMLEL